MDGRRTLRKPPLPALPPVKIGALVTLRCGATSATGSVQAVPVAASAQCLESAADSNDYCGLQGGVSSQRWCCRPKRRISLWRAKDRLACRFRLSPRGHATSVKRSRTQPLQLCLAFRGAAARAVATEHLAAAGTGEEALESGARRRRVERRGARAAALGVGRRREVEQVEPIYRHQGNSQQQSQSVLHTS